MHLYTTNNDSHCWRWHVLYCRETRSGSHASFSTTRRYGICCRYVYICPSASIVGVLRPRHQTEIVNGAHPGPGPVRIAYTPPCPSIDASQNEPPCSTKLQLWSLSIFNTHNAKKYLNLYLATQIEHDESSYFCRGPDHFCWGLVPVGPTLVTGPVSSTYLYFIYQMAAVAQKKQIHYGANKQIKKQTNKNNLTMVGLFTFH